MSGIIITTGASLADLLQGFYRIRHTPRDGTSRRQLRPSLVEAALRRDALFRRPPDVGRQAVALAPVSEAGSATRMHTIWTKPFYY